MKTVAILLCAALATAPSPAGGGKSCAGCREGSEGPTTTQGAGISVAYQFHGQGRTGMSSSSGTCVDADLGHCADSGCSVAPYTLTIKNTSATRSLIVQDSRQGGSTVVAPGDTLDVNFGNPGAGSAEAIPCGQEISLTLSMLDSSGVGMGTREFTWTCSSCVAPSSQGRER